MICTQASQQVIDQESWHRRLHLSLLAVTASFCMATLANAELLVYEPFNYTVGPLVGEMGGIGFAEPWTYGQQGGEPTVYDETSASVLNNNAAGDIDWDGVVNNLPTNPAPPAARFISSGPSGTADRITANRTLSQSAGELAGADNVLWASVVWHQLGSNFGRHIGFAVGTDGLSNRSVNVDKSGNFGAGIGDAIGVGGAINTLAVTPTVWQNGSAAVRTTIGATNVSTALDNIVVLRFDFADGATADTVTAYTFNENVDLLESTFNANAVSASAVIDQDTFNILSFSQSRGQEAIDEIRLGDTFTDVISGIVTPPPLRLQVNVVTGSVDLLGDCDEPLNINFYQMTSSGNSLNPGGWSSLADQDFEGNGPVDNTGNGWEEATTVTSSALAEGYLLGDSTIIAGAVIGIGQAYDRTINARDIKFRYRIDTGQVFDGDVEYISELTGDFNSDGTIDAADYTVWRDSQGQTGTGLAADGNGDEVVDSDDYDIWRSNFGLSLPSALLESPGGVPEPRTITIGFMVFSTLVVARRQYALLAN